MLNELIEVSIVICSYNPQWNKLEMTLKSAVKQENVEFEIIVADDGSRNNFFDKVERFFTINNFKRYVLIGNKENKGTVKNLLSGIKVANGKYIATISPGDAFFDNNCIADFYNFCINNTCDVCFGNAVYYSNKDGNLKIFDSVSHPNCPEFFQKTNRKREEYLIFTYGSGILGASIFREKNYALKYIGLLEDVCIYVEDNTSVLFGIMEGFIPKYYDRDIIYYEYGTGISTNNDKDWGKKIKEDFTKAYALLHEYYPKNRFIRFINNPSAYPTKLKKCLYPGIINMLKYKHYVSMEQKQRIKSKVEITNLVGYLDGN